MHSDDCENVEQDHCLEAFPPLDAIPPVRSQNLTKSNPDLRLSQTTWFTWVPQLWSCLGILSPLTSFPPQITWAIQPLRLYDLIWAIPFRLDHLITSITHLPPLVLGLPLDSSIYTTWTFRYCPLFICPGSCTLLQLGLVPFLSTLLSAFSHCLVTILYKPIYRSCSSLVQISHLVSLSCCLIITPLSLNYALNFTCPLDSLT